MDVCIAPRVSRVEGAGVGSGVGQMRKAARRGGAGRVWAALFRGSERWLLCGVALLLRATWRR